MLVVAVVPFHKLDATRKRPIVERDVKDEPTEDFDGEGLSDRSRSWSATKLAIHRMGSFSAKDENGSGSDFCVED